MIGATINWVGGEHHFALTIGGLRAVQDACDAGPMQVMMRLRAGHWRIDDLMSVIRHGLIGGGMAEAEARKLVANLFDAHPLASFVITAQLILAAAVTGVKDDPVGEPEGAMSPPENGGSASSTATERKPDSGPVTLTK